MALPCSGGARKFKRARDKRRAPSSLISFRRPAVRGRASSSFLLVSGAANNSYSGRRCVRSRRLSRRRPLLSSDVFTAHFAYILSPFLFSLTSLTKRTTPNEHALFCFVFHRLRVIPARSRITRKAFVFEVSMPTTCVK